MAVIVKAKVREMMRGTCNVSEEFLKRLDTQVTALVRRSTERARMNGRKTLKARDL